MASQQAPQQAFEPVLAALTSMQSSESRSQKNQAHEFLESFQKSVCFGYYYPPFILLLVYGQY